jgi:hypothetical protein
MGHGARGLQSGWQCLGLLHPRSARSRAYHWGEDRLAGIFLRDESGRRPVYGGMEKFQTDPYWRDHLLFHEYFHGDNGAGLGASHQTGWTGVIARLIQIFGSLDAQAYLKLGKGAAFLAK